MIVVGMNDESEGTLIYRAIGEYVVFKAAVDKDTIVFAKTFNPMMVGDINDESYGTRTPPAIGEYPAFKVAVGMDKIGGAAIAAAAVALAVSIAVLGHGKTPGDKGCDDEIEVAKSNNVGQGGNNE